MIKNKHFIFLISLLSYILVGCTSAGVSETDIVVEYPTPTTHDLFQIQDDVSINNGEVSETRVATPTVADLFAESKTSTPKPTLTATHTQSADKISATITQTESMTVTIYSDEFNPNWTLITTDEVDIDEEANAPVYSGHNAIAITPSIGLAKVNFVVDEESVETYPRSQVLGIRFWINSGEGPIAPSDLAVSMLGSNEYPYYVEGDTSVTNIYEPVFSETRLFYLDFNRSIPPQTWVEVILWLDDLIYDPVYEYFVGFYLRNEESLTQTFFVDDVHLFLLNKVEPPQPAVEETSQPEIPSTQMPGEIE